ncbi:hypothetical protein GH714_002980 [Hevea brasiliensis]|uniref:Chromo domain-containing protein n=1 Tax=Hevea brasiliensis TaxID=3981 RepID=A0A6A6KIG3_HEVBR|nr:hypothetical protein GH714_002980 [Hevea brasiliensis]
MQQRFPNFLLEDKHHLEDGSNASATSANSGTTDKVDPNGPAEANPNLIRYLVKWHGPSNTDATWITKKRFDDAATANDTNVKIGSD